MSGPETKKTDEAATSGATNTATATSASATSKLLITSRRQSSSGDNTFRIADGAAAVTAAGNSANMRNKTLLDDMIKAQQAMSAGPRASFKARL